MRRIAGVDEAGRGPLAGPVVAAAVVFEEGYRNHRIKDSKKLSARAREELVQVIKDEALAWSIVAVGHHRIERLNIRGASLTAMSLALHRVPADLVLVDGDARIYTHIEQHTVVKGDAKHVEIGAASILAKVWRDHLMCLLDRRYPGYELAAHSGYPTPLHRERIAQLGASPVHRRTFRGVREYLRHHEHFIGAVNQGAVINAEQSEESSGSASDLALETHAAPQSPQVAARVFS